MSSERAPGRRRRIPRVRAPALALGLGLLALAAGCVALLRAASAPESEVFHHAVHEEQDLACTDCHEGAEMVPGAGMPEPDVCLTCHEPEIDTPELSARVEAYAARAPEARYIRGATFADVRFDHAAHAGAEVACTECHPDAESGSQASPDGPPLMPACVECHEQRGAPIGCPTCHERITCDTPPPNHLRSGWVRTHGPLSRMADQQALLERCAVCHSQDHCDRCHAREQPRNHGQSWRVATHGLEAAMDRSRCMVCHDTDSCERCHRTEPPRSHRASFRPPSSRHCLTCHQPLALNACSTCHEAAHLSAPSRPANAQHAGATEDLCRTCHTTIGLPHVDNGDSCVTCH